MKVIELIKKWVAKDKTLINHLVQNLIVPISLEEVHKPQNEQKAISKPTKVDSLIGRDLVAMKNILQFRENGAVKIN